MSGETTKTVTNEYRKKMRTSFLIQVEEFELVTKEFHHVIKYKEWEGKIDKLINVLFVRYLNEYYESNREHQDEPDYFLDEKRRVFKNYPMSFSSIMEGSMWRFKYYKLNDDYNLTILVSIILIMIDTNNLWKTSVDEIMDFIRLNQTKTIMSNSGLEQINSSNDIISFLFSYFTYYSDYFDETEKHNNILKNKYLVETLGANKKKHIQVWSREISPFVEYFEYLKELNFKITILSDYCLEANIDDFCFYYIEVLDDFNHLFLTPSHNSLIFINPKIWSDDIFTTYKFIGNMMCYKYSLEEVQKQLFSSNAPIGILNSRQKELN